LFGFICLVSLLQSVVIEKKGVGFEECTLYSLNFTVNSVKHRGEKGIREIGEVYLPSQLERTQKALLVMVDKVKRRARAPPPPPNRLG
jgi:hypothetical protein